MRNVPSAQVFNNLCAASRLIVGRYHGSSVGIPRKLEEEY
jgi:hypothetical protein